MKKEEKRAVEFIDAYISAFQIYITNLPHFQNTETGAIKLFIDNIPTKREYFAAKALTANWGDMIEKPEFVAKCAVALADALIEALKAEEPKP